MAKVPDLSKVFREAKLQWRTKALPEIIVATKAEYCRAKAGRLRAEGKKARLPQIKEAYTDLARLWRELADRPRKIDRKPAQKI